MNDLINSLDLYLGKKAPQLPKGLKDFIVKVYPWANSLWVVFSVWAFYSTYFLLSRALGGASDILSAFGMNDLARAMRPSIGTVFSSFGVWHYLTIAYMALNAIAIPGLFKKNQSGWNFVFYGSIVYTISIFFIDPLRAIIYGLIYFYFLFQIRGFYFGTEFIGAPSNNNPIPQRPQMNQSNQFSQNQQFQSQQPNINQGYSNSQNQPNQYNQQNFNQPNQMPQQSQNFQNQQQPNQFSQNQQFQPQQPNMNQGYPNSQNQPNQSNQPNFNQPNQMPQQQQVYGANSPFTEQNSDNTQTNIYSNPENNRNL